MSQSPIAGTLRLATFTVHLLIHGRTSEAEQARLVDALEAIDLRRVLEACAQAEVNRHPSLTYVVVIAEE
jgi:hypothetical protein